MVIVAGALYVAPEERDRYVGESVDVVTQARHAPGCLDFAVSADIVEPGRINVFERWATLEQLHDFRGSGPDDGQQARLLRIEVAEYAVQDLS